jgi:hypothetical protein
MPPRTQANPRLTPLERRSNSSRPLTHSIDLFEPYIPNPDDNKVWVAWRTHVELVRMSKQHEFSSEDIKKIDCLVVESNKAFRAVPQFKGALS